MKHAHRHRGVGTAAVWGLAVVALAFQPPPVWPDPGPIEPHHCCVSGDYNRDGSVDGADVEDFFRDFDDGLVDVNCDGRIDVVDVAEFLDAWTRGVGCP